MGSARCSRSEVDAPLRCQASHEACALQLVPNTLIDSIDYADESSPGVRTTPAEAETSEKQVLVRGMKRARETTKLAQTLLASVLLSLPILATAGCSADSSADSDDEPTGPDTSNQLTWESMEAPYQGQIHSVYISEQSGILVGTSSGLCRSLDDGETWVIDPEGGTCRLVTSTPGGQLWAVVNNLLHRSDDAGSSWDAVLTLGEKSWDAVVGIGDSIILVGSDSAIPAPVCRSNNLGGNWEEVITGFDHPVESYIVGVWSLLKISDNDVLAGTTAGIYKSVDAGLTWSRSSNGFATDQENLSIFVLSLGMDSEGTLYAGSWIGVGIYRSTDEGSTWEYSGLDHVATMFMVPHVSGPLLAGTSSGIYATFDHGDSWIYLGLDEMDIRGIAFDVSGTTIYAGGVHHGALWRAASNW